ncbi:hypothetical protein BD560DRAFT_432243 [Blakeslea trispora]|nr:hypothetical protein BD560DRAFT_432243 [Blakeslea trispora]
MDNCSRSFPPEYQLTIATCFALPTKAALIPAPSSSFHLSTYWKQTTINTFFTVDSTNMKIIHRSNRDCSFPSNLNNIRWAVATGDISLHPSIVHRMQHISNCEAPVDLQPVIDTLQYNGIPLMNLKKKQFRRMILSNLMPETSLSPIPRTSASQWQAFVDAPMRNVWYRLIHHQLSNILGAILQSICRAHWDEVFNSIAFVKASVLNAAHKKILRSNAFLELK